MITFSYTSVCFFLLRNKSIGNFFHPHFKSRKNFALHHEHITSILSRILNIYILLSASILSALVKEKIGNKFTIPFPQIYIQSCLILCYKKHKTDSIERFLKIGQNLWIISRRRILFCDSLLNRMRKHQQSIFVEIQIHT